MASGVYVIINTANGKYYIGSSNDMEARWGQHRRSLRAGTHRNKYLQNAYNKHGPEHFQYFILEETANCVEREQFWLDTLQATKRGYNLLPNAFTTLGYRHTEEVKQLLSKLHKGNQYCLGFKHTEAAKQNMSDSKKGRTFSPEAREKLSLALKGKPLSDERKTNISKSLVGRKHSAETKAKMSQSRQGKKPTLGIKCTEDAKQKIRQALKGRKRPPFSDETKARMSQAQKARRAKRAT